MVDGDIRPRLATAADAAAITSTLSAAFDADPLWSWAFPDDEKRPTQYQTFFGLFVESAIPNGWVWTIDQAAAVAVWTPPGKSELSEEAEAKIKPFLEAELGAHAEAVSQVFASFEAACPDDADFYYLSLLGTHPDHRGRGLGMELLGANLAQIDAESMPAYLESSNPANDSRYERLGFEPRTEFSTPEGQHTVTTMWRKSQY
ncbi:MAG TPA: GNAT family N-acetyltransferase [Solirubrobacterales bacterium]|jgi:GNAT superfamily N-acetyltransferase|nr:GNAT family N-acetyltransferase [Solirubrobacterales bacterium]